MEYVYDKSSHVWFNLSTYKEVHNFDSKSNKMRIKLYNRRTNRHYSKYSYVDASDIKFIWSNGTFYGECNCDGINSSFNISPDRIENPKRARKLVDDSPGNIMNYVLRYVDILMRDPNLWTTKWRKVNRKELNNLLVKNVESKLTPEQLLAYELRKDEITKLIDDFDGGKS